MTSVTRASQIYDEADSSRPNSTFCFPESIHFFLIFLILLFSLIPLTELRLLEVGKPFEWRLGWCMISRQGSRQLMNSPVAQQNKVRLAFKERHFLHFLCMLQSGIHEFVANWRCEDFCAFSSAILKRLRRWRCTLLCSSTGCHL